jgi:hypothetical protein
MQGGDGGGYKDGYKVADTACEGNNSTHKFGGPPGSPTRGGDDKAVGTARDKNNNTYKFGGPSGAADSSARSLLRGGDQHAGGGVRLSRNSRTIEVCFMIDVSRRHNFNLCMRLREFIVEARVIDPTFSILPLGGNWEETITKQEVWPNTKEGIHKYYSHWSLPHNVAGKMKIVTAPSMMQLKNQSGTFLPYLKRKGVQINYAQLGMVETATLGWIGQAHPYFGCRDETKE